MEEEKAHEYYTELLEKGSGAAKFKQGLGFHSTTSSSRLDSRTDSLESARDSFWNKFQPANVNNNTDSSPSKLEGCQINERRTEPGEKRGELRRSRSRSIERRRRSRSRENKSSRSRERRRSKSRERRSRSRENKRSRSRERRRSKSRERRSRSRENKRSKSRERRRSKSRERRSRSRENKRSKSRERRRSKSKERRRSRSRSQEQRNRRSRSRSQDRISRRRSRNYYENDRKVSRATERRKGSPNSNSRQISNSYSEPTLQQRDLEHGCEISYDPQKYRVPRKPIKHEFSKLIPGYDKMTPGERVKAKMRLQLTETAARDSEKGSSTDWERFSFDKFAPLDGDSKQNYFGDGTGSRDDTLFLKNSGSGFKSSQTEVKRENHTHDLHENAIFGAPGGSVGAKSHANRTSSFRLDSQEVQQSFVEDEGNEDDLPVIVSVEEATRIEEITNSDEIQAENGAVLATQAQRPLSWQERARLRKEQRLQTNG